MIEENNKKENKEEKKDAVKLGDLERCKEKCEEYLNGWKRERADFLNYKKEEAERVSTVVKYANEEVILSILPILDHLMLAEKELPHNLREGKGDSKAVEWTKGFLQIKKQVQELLQQHGVQEIKTLGKPFDPSLMESTGEISNSQFPISNTVAGEVQKGYMLHGKVIRPAKVKVTK